MSAEDAAPRDATAATGLHVSRPERVLVIVAHPDDADFGPAGTVAGWVRQGTVAHLVCCTSGDAGSDDARTDPLELARIR
jgi:LmbE family N-acetylglucosaminyl deacetylase